MDEQDEEEEQDEQKLKLLRLDHQDHLLYAHNLGQFLSLINDSLITD